jgi:GNAT superfamily N-acetyltransferase
LCGGWQLGVGRWTTARQTGSNLPMADAASVVVHRPAGPLPAHIVAEMEAVLFEASGRVFAPGPEREAFCERWLARYLGDGSDVVLLAFSGDRTLAGYLVGALEDPAAQPRFLDLVYLSGEFRDLCRRYPAHLHLNLAPAFRGKGLGASLVAAFAAHARDAGAAGMHVVTRANAPNVRFYARCGFAEAGRCAWDGSKLVFLAQTL